MGSQIVLLDASPDSFVSLKTPDGLPAEQFRPLEPVASVAA
jgi:hypothetical protein